MNTLPTHQNYSIQSPGHVTLAGPQARRRQVLGILLIAIGGIWLCLRFVGIVGHVPLPIDWVIAGMAMVERGATSGFGPRVVLTACGILNVYLILRTP